jgi:hypothetical protein
VKVEGRAIQKENKMLNYPSRKIVTVCDKCLTETCFKGQFPCTDRLSGDANSITDTEENIGQLPTKTRHGFNEESTSLEIEKDGRWYFTLDERFGVDVPERDGPGVAWIIANTLAFGAGYSCFGENSQPLNMFKTRLHCITGAVSDIEALQPESESAQ